MIEPLEGKALQAVQVPPGCQIVAYDGAVRSSKTVASLLLWIEYVMHGPPGMLLMAGRTETAVINNLVIPLQEMLGVRRVVLNRGTGTVNILGREVRMLGANDEQARTKIQGMTLAGAYLDEAANVPQSFFNMLVSRLSVPGAMLILTCNPEGPKHWLLVEWLLRARWWVDSHGERHEHDAGTMVRVGARNLSVLDVYRVTFILDDNTFLARNNPRFVEQLKSSWPPGSMWHRRYILSQWVSSEGAVYDMWDEPAMTLQAAQLPPIDRFLFVGLDYGTTHRTRAYSLGLARVNVGVDGRPDWESTQTAIDPARSRVILIVLGEFAPGTATVGEHARQFDDWYTRQCDLWGMEADWIAVDAAAATFRTEVLSRGYTNVMGAHKSVVPGIQTVASLLAGGRLYVVADRCPFLIESLPSYMWDKKATDRGTTAPLKENDDEADALRYAVYTSRSYWSADIPLAPVQVDDGLDEDGVPV